MNRVSKIFCIVGLVAVIGGSITLGVGMAQGGVFRRFTKAEKKTKQFVINEENLKNNKVVLEDIEISIKSGNIRLFESEDEILIINYTYAIDEKRIFFPSVEKPFYIVEKNRAIDWLSLDFLIDNDSFVDIYIPNWFNGKYNLETLNGEVYCNLKEYKNDLFINSGSSYVEISEFSYSKNMDISVFSGNVVIDASSFSKMNEQNLYYIETVNGDLDFVMPYGVSFSYNYEKVTGKMHNSCTICESEKCPYISFSTVNGDFNIKYKN